MQMLDQPSHSPCPGASTGWIPLTDTILSLQPSTRSPLSIIRSYTNTLHIAHKAPGGDSWIAFTSRSTRQWNTHQNSLHYQSYTVSGLATAVNNKDFILITLHYTIVHHKSRDIIADTCVDTMAEYKVHLLVSSWAISCSRCDSSSSSWPISWICSSDITTPKPCNDEALIRVAYTYFQ